MPRSNLPLSTPSPSYHALVAARIIYLLSISQLGLSLVQVLRRKATAITPAPILVIGIVGAVILQVIFSQWSVMNTLFSTAPLTWQQGLICLIPMIPMIPVAFLAHTLDAPTKKPQPTPLAQRP